MAVTKKEVLKTLTEDGRQQIAQLETLIDKELREHYTGDYPVIVIPDKELSSRVEKKIKEIYSDWNVKFRSCQMEGDWIEFS